MDIKTKGNKKNLKQNLRLLILRVKEKQIYLQMEYVVMIYQGLSIEGEISLKGEVTQKKFI